MKDGQPFFMMESTPSNVNWHDVNKLPKPGMQELSAIQAVAHGADSVQYFQWRKSRNGHEKYHGAIVDHVGHENTRVFKGIARLGECEYIIVI
ncbi:MAG: beta-galactosidase [Clostridia bacterium]|nr:beta-galactosidase [Clostridia bacterium]